MPRDRREEVLVRLEAIALTIPGVATVARNTIAISDTARPAIVVLDGDEELVRDHGSSGGRGSMGARLMDMTPQLFVLVGAKGAEIGPSLSALRVALLAAVETDAALLAIVGSNGFVAYDGLGTDLAAGRTVAGNMQLQIRIRYPLIPAEYRGG